jgi:hypothetical protein
LASSFIFGVLTSEPKAPMSPKSPMSPKAVLPPTGNKISAFSLLP